MSWFVYVLACSDGTIYTGITTCVNRRLHEHNHKNNGAKYTRSRRPVRLLWADSCDDRRHAQRVEYHIKSLRKEQKFAYLCSTGTLAADIRGVYGQLKSDQDV